MKQFVKAWRNRLECSSEQGFTLIELIASLTLLSVVMGVIYSSITFGLHTYNKARIENSLRDEGDIVMSSITAEFYRLGPERILQSDQFKQAITLETRALDSEDGTGPDQDIQKEEISIRPNAQKKNALFINDQEVLTESELIPNNRIDQKGNSYIELKCLKAGAKEGCSSGLIEIRLKLRQFYGGKNYDLDLTSRFGF